MSADLATELDAARRLAADRNRPAAIGLGSVLVGSSAVESLAAVVADVARPGDIVILEDATCMMRAGQEVKPLVAGLLGKLGAVRRVLVGGSGHAVHADTETIGAASAAASGAGCVVAVGSGTVTDIGKEVARAHGVPLVVVQTAASVNGFADDMAVVLRDGVKRTIPSVWPSALVIDTAVLQDAPPALTRSGFAEMLSMFTAPADWRLAAAVGQDDRFDPGVIALFRPRGASLLAAAPHLGAGDETAVHLLATLLTASGLAMGVAGNTAPSSGMEHLISHLIDMSAGADGRQVGLHGAQVGVASVVAACVWQRLLAVLEPDDLLRAEPQPDEMRQRIDAAFRPLDPSGRTADECWSDYRRKLDRWTAGREHRAALAAAWAGVRRELAELVGDPVAMASALGAAGAAACFTELDPPVTTARVRWALASGHLMRDRFTVADLAFLTGHWTDDDVAAVLDRAASLAGGS